MWPLYDASPTPEQKIFLSAARRLISDRGTTLLPKRLNVFTTKYDPLIEVALEELGIPFNDGFAGRMSPRFDSSSFSRLMCEQSLFMEYTSQVTPANVLKLHGSLTWRRNDDGPFPIRLLRIFSPHASMAAMGLSSCRLLAT